MPGKVYPLGRRRGVAAGREIVTGLADVEGVPELAVLLIPADRVPETLEECGEKGIRYAIVESGGFSEFTGERRSLEDRIRETSLKWGMKIIGPNCFGAINLEARLVLPFFTLNPRFMKEGRFPLYRRAAESSMTRACLPPRIRWVCASL